MKGTINVEKIKRNWVWIMICSILIHYGIYLWNIEMGKLGGIIMIMIWMIPIIYKGFHYAVSQIGHEYIEEVKMDLFRYGVLMTTPVCSILMYQLTNPLF